MSEKEINPAEVVKEFIRAMEVMDFDAALEHVAADVEYINSPGTTSRSRSRSTRFARTTSTLRPPARRHRRSAACVTHVTAASG